ncbi:MAG TPA: SIR2 family protein [Pseudonocardiaceae bacterium]|jgi:translation initiation factor 2B subunit (eIF-2B alpha/beta/delta family)|nr:SIR2 family protein [Pseudonocardiaceae bacterium]
MTEDRALIERVAAGVADGLVVPILGAGCSASQQDAAGREYQGFPLAAEFAQHMRQRFDYLHDATDFYATNVLITANDGPGSLVAELQRTYGPAQRLPAYDALALLPFDSAISFNFDESFEDALARAGRTPSIVLADADVPLSRHAAVTVLKPHGTVSHGASLRATRKRVGDLDRDCPLIISLLQVLLANRTPLFVGYGFGDNDIVAAVQRIRAWSPESYRRATAILPMASKSLRAELDELKIDVLTGVAVEILDAIAAEYFSHGQQRPVDSERWRAHPFFRELVTVRGRPSETQVVEALLSTTEERIAADSVTEAVRQAAGAARLCLTYRRNYAGLERVAAELDKIAGSDNDETAWRLWRAYLERRRAMRRNISEKAGAALADAERLLIYAQSQRVIDLLMDLEPGRRRRLTLIVSECRSKSAEPFKNARLIAERLDSGRFRSIEILADMAAMHIMLNDGVDMVLMGAHKVFMTKEVRSHPLAVVNAVGAEAVCLVAEHAGVPVLFAFEDEKIVYTDSLKTARESVSFDPETDISGPVHGPARWVWRQIGYDLVRWRDNMHALIGSAELPVG